MSSMYSSHKKKKNILARYISTHWNPSPQKVPAGQKRWLSYKDHCCSSRGPGFNSQHRRGSSQSPTAPVQEIQLQLKRFNSLFWLPRAPSMHMVHRRACTQNIHTHKIISQGGSKMIINSRLLKEPVKNRAMVVWVFCWFFFFFLVVRICIHTPVLNLWRTLEL